MMDSKKDNKTVRDLLPLFCVLAILLLIAQNINLTVQVSNLQIKVQNQDLRIFNLEDIYGSKENGEIVEEQNVLESIFPLKSGASKYEPDLGEEDGEEHKIMKRSPGKNGNVKGRRKRCKRLCKGRRGERGEKGEKGEEGEKGEKGEQGQTGLKGEKGEIGRTGERGSAGYSGPKGERGEVGRHGEKGVKGDRGLRGKAGPSGSNGMQGVKGDKGEKGKDGNSKTTELIHLVGNSNGKSSTIDMLSSSKREAAVFRHWKPEEKFGKVTYNDGYIHIRLTGFYYVYCQIHYSGNISYNRHQVRLKNKHKTTHLLLGLDTFGQKNYEYSKHSTTKFTGGVFRLTQGDQISVLGIRTQYTFLPTSSYFGLFLLHDLS